MLGSSQFNATSYGRPVPLKLIVTLGVAVEFVAIVNCPVAAAVATGANCAFNVAVCPTFSVRGNASAAIENGAPATVVELIVTGPEPVDVRVIGWVAIVFSATFPNARLVGLTLSCPEAAGVSWSEKLADTPFADPAMTAVCAEVTCDVATLNVALLAPAATVTEDGTTAATLLLVRLIACPAGPAAPFKVTMHASVPAPLIAEDAQEMELKTATPAALMLMTRFPVEELLAMVRTPVKELT